MGIEPTAQAWEAWVLPLYDARNRFDSSRVARVRQIVRVGSLVHFRAVTLYRKRIAQPFPFHEFRITGDRTVE